MRSIKIVADSSANLTALDGVDFSCAPLKIICADREFVDDSTLDLEDMHRYFAHYKSRSQTSCPNPTDYLDSFGDAREVFCVTITSGLSGSYNSACIAKQLYEHDHPDRQVHVIDSLSAGPELELLIEKLQELIAQNRSFDEICNAIESYKEQTSLVFMLASLKNFAANGRVSPAVAKLTGLLGIRVVGQASPQGQLDPTYKCRGEAKSLTTMVQHMEKLGAESGKVRIAHNQNQEAAEKLKTLLLERFPQMDVQIRTCRGLCSYYAETGGMLVGYEKL